RWEQLVRHAARRRSRPERYREAMERLEAELSGLDADLISPDRVAEILKSADHFANAHLDEIALLAETAGLMFRPFDATQEEAGRLSETGVEELPAVVGDRELVSLGAAAEIRGWSASETVKTL